MALPIERSNGSSAGRHPTAPPPVVDEPPSELDAPVIPVVPVEAVAGVEPVDEVGPVDGAAAVVRVAWVSGWVRATTTLSVLLVALVAAVASYEHMRALAVVAGEGWRAWLRPSLAPE